ncbi:MAG: RNA methyltransferase [Spirochaetota bacterium]
MRQAHEISGLLGRGILGRGIRDRDLEAEGLIVAEGRLLVERLLALREPGLLGVYATEEAAARFASLVADRCPLVALSEGELSTMAGYPFHRGVFAVARRPPAKDAASLVEELLAARMPPLLLLPETRDQENLGSLVRSAAAFGLGAVLLGPTSADFLSRRVVRVSMGAAFDMPHVRLASPSDLAAFRLAGYSLTAAVLDDAAAVDAGNWSPRGPHILAFGAEYEGLGADWREACDEAVTIGMAPGPDSLNVAAAGAILMWRLCTAIARDGPLG